jgi:hypothetical protein
LAWGFFVVEVFIFACLNHHKSDLTAAFIKVFIKVLARISR